MCTNRGKLLVALLEELVLGGGGGEWGAADDGGFVSPVAGFALDTLAKILEIFLLNVG